MPFSTHPRVMNVVHLPPWRTLLHRSGRQLLENALAPLLVFYAILATAGLFWAMAGALGLCYLTILLRLVRRIPVPALLLVGTALATARSLVGMSTGSAFFYFLQPSLGNFLIAAVFLVSVAMRRPIAARLAREFCAFPSSVVEHDRLRGFFRQVSLLWALVFCANGAVTIWMLVSVPLTAFLFLSFGASSALIVVGVALSLVWFRRSLQRAGMRLHVGEPSTVAP